MGISLQVQAARKGPAGNVTVVSEYANLVSELELTSQRFDAAGQLTFTCIENGKINIPEGSAVILSVDGKQLFKGYIFTAERSQEDKTSYTAHDQLRYLKANASYVFEAMSLAQIIRQIASDFGLTVGTLEETGYSFPCLISENESCLDIIFNALAETIIQTGRIFNFYDDCGALTLREARGMYVKTLLGQGSLVTDYTYKRDIDSDTYNRIKLVRPNSSTGRTDVYLCEDTDTIRSWGLLQYYDQVDENMNEAQIEEMCRMYLQYYNRVLRTITLEGIGVKEVRAGSIVPVRIGEVDELSVPRLLMTEKVVHRFEGDAHTMEIEVKNFEQLGGMSIV